MKIGALLKEKQPKEFKELKNNFKATKDNLSFRDIENLMRHDSYIRGRRGAIRQVRHG